MPRPPQDRPQHDQGGEDAPRPSSPAKLAVVGVLALLAFIGLVALGTWQVERRAWKLDLIARVDARIHAPAIPAPAQPSWPDISAATDEYRHIQATGRFDHQREVLVQANTLLGPGFWVMAPLRTQQGFTLLVNRGFVPTELRERQDRAAADTAGDVTVSGLLRLTEPKGGFLRSNDPANNRWFSRDVAAIAAAQGVTGPVAPYFLDADDTPHPGRWPAGGLTVVWFPNNHLVYALTWYGLALMVAGAAAYLAREEWQARRRRTPAEPQVPGRD
jgi:surfeit locus 1 family protein